ncbi:uncharacterized protein FIBRA_01020 [Fibroporia radiculosa]|uniref:Uncharacterized protein n=1 Tax=Fibroporia radiculosa TaxID=599839 RepID=J4HSM3_9APHY|nr:uncharacterized protein FIBRA_01020 [Fibroporia radiculosa]CCL99012.1 predicted protein [Fibroporia radiculosa]
MVSRSLELHPCIVDELLALQSAEITRLRTELENEQTDSRMGKAQHEKAKRRFVTADDLGQLREELYTHASSTRTNVKTREEQLQDLVRKLEVDLEEARIVLSQSEKREAELLKDFEDVVSHREVEAADAMHPKECSADLQRQLAHKSQEIEMSLLRMEELEESLSRAKAYSILQNELNEKLHDQTLDKEQMEEMRKELKSISAEKHALDEELQSKVWAYTENIRDLQSVIRSQDSELCTLYARLKIEGSQSCESVFESRVVAQASDPLRAAPPGASIQQIFGPFARQASSFEKIKQSSSRLSRQCRTPNIIQVTSELEWNDCPRVGFYIKPEKKRSKKKWSSAKALKNTPQGKIELIANPFFFQSRFCYLGTYTVSAPQKMSPSEFQSLSTRIKDRLFAATGKAKHVTEIRQMYNNGNAAALLFKVTRISDATVQSLLTLQSAEIARLHHKLADTESQFDQTITYRPSQDSDGSDVRVLREQLCDLVDKIKPIQMIHSVSEELEAANKSNLELQMSFEELKNDFVTLRTEKDEISGMLQSEKESKAALEEDLAQLRMREANLRAEWAMSENDVKEEIFSLLNELDDQHVVTDDLRQQFCETTTEKNVKGFQLHEQLELYRKAQMQKTIVHVQELDAVRAELATCRAELEAVKQAEVRSTLEVPANDPLRTAAIDHPVPVMTSLTWSENLDKIKTMFVPITSTASLETFTKFL